MVPQLKNKRMNGIALVAASIALSILFAGKLFAEKNGNQSAQFLRKIEQTGVGYLTIQTTGGNFITAVSTEEGQFLIRNTSKSGERLWERRFQFPQQLPPDTYISAAGVAETTDGGFVVLGEIDCENCIADAFFLVKLNSDGNLLWKKAFDGGESTAFSRFRSVYSRPDGGFVVVGSQMLIRFTSKGNILWERNFNGFVNGLMESVSTSDNGLVLLFRKQGAILVAKFQDSGNIVWKRSMALPEFGASNSQFATVASSEDNGLVVAGNLNSSIFLIGLDSDGKLGWKSRYSSGSNWTFVDKVKQSSDKGFLVTGVVDDSVIFLKTDTSGKPLFEKQYDEIGGFFLARFSFETPDRGFLLFGNFAYDDGVDGLIPTEDEFVLKVDSSGNVPDCIGTKSQNLKIVPFGSLKIVNGFPLNITNPITFHEKGLDLNASASFSKVTGLCAQ